MYIVPNGIPNLLKLFCKIVLINTDKEEGNKVAAQNFFLNAFVENAIIQMEILCIRLSVVSKSHCHYLSLYTNNKFILKLGLIYVIRI